MAAASRRGNDKFMPKLKKLLTITIYLRGTDTANYVFNSLKFDISISLPTPHAKVKK